MVSLFDDRELARNPSIKDGLEIMKRRVHKDKSMDYQVLKAFFAIRPCRISSDLGSLSSLRSTLRAQEKFFSENGWETSGQIVESFHRRLLLSYEMSRVSKLPRDLVLFSATLTAHEIAELSCAASTGSGMLGELAGMAELREDSGQAEEVKERAVLSARLFDRIHDAVFLEVLERYGMRKYALIFEQNRPLYEIRCEVGRRLLSPDLVDKKEHLETLARFRMLFGPGVVQEFLRRLRQRDILPY